MGLEELVGRLERDAAARIAAIEARAQAEVDAIAVEAARSSASVSEQALTARRAERRARLDRELAAARHAARADRLRAEHSLLGRIMDRAAALLDEMDHDDAVVRALPERLSSALRFVEGRAARILCRPVLSPAVRAACATLVAAGREAVTVEEVASTAAGFSVIAADGSVEVDDTLPSRLERMRPRLSIVLLAEVGP